MITLTKEWLLTTIAELEEERDAVPGAVNEDADKALAAMKIALASLEAEPVKRVNADQMHRVCLEANRHLDKYGAMAKEVNKLLGRAAPPAPVSVPDAATAIRACMEEFPESVHDIVEECAAIAENACRAAMLQGAEPVTTGYKLRDAVDAIRNSGIAIDAEKILAERDALNAPDCWCQTCRPVTISDMRFVVCPECGNKRCPHANDHQNACTGSNEPGQEGSAYPAAPQQEAKS